MKLKKLLAEFNLKARFKNIGFYIGTIGTLFLAGGFDVSTFTSWDLVGQAIISIVNSPVKLLAVVMALVGIFTDTSTKGILDNKEVE